MLFFGGGRRWLLKFLMSIIGKNGIVQNIGGGLNKFRPLANEDLLEQERGLAIQKNQVFCWAYKSFFDLSVDKCHDNSCHALNVSCIRV